MVTNLLIFALISLVLYLIFTKNSVEGMINLGGTDYQKSQKTITSNGIEKTGSYLQTAQSLLKEAEQYPRSQKAMLNILDSDLMRFFDVSPKTIAVLRDAVASPVGDVVKIREHIKDLVEMQKNAN